MDYEDGIKRGRPTGIIRDRRHSLKAMSDAEHSR